MLNSEEPENRIGSAILDRVADEVAGLSDYRDHRNISGGILVERGLVWLRSIRILTGEPFGLDGEPRCDPELGGQLDTSTDMVSEPGRFLESFVSTRSVKLSTRPKAVSRRHAPAVEWPPTWPAR